MDSGPSSRLLNVISFWFDKSCGYEGYEGEDFELKFEDEAPCFAPEDSGKYSAMDSF